MTDTITYEPDFVIFQKVKMNVHENKILESVWIVCFRGRIFEQTNIQKSQMVYPNQKYFSNDSIGPIQ